MIDVFSIQLSTQTWNTLRGYVYFGVGVVVSGVMGCLKPQSKVLQRVASFSGPVFVTHS